MISRTRITLVDDDGLRRARISSSCARAGVHVEPYDSPEELGEGVGRALRATAEFSWEPAPAP